MSKDTDQSRITAADNTIAVHAAHQDVYAAAAKLADYDRKIRTLTLSLLVAVILMLTAFGLASQAAQRNTTHQLISIAQSNQTALDILQRQSLPPSEQHYIISLIQCIIATSNHNAAEVYNATINGRLATMPVPALPPGCPPSSP